jgi:hypothetical protein
MITATLRIFPLLWACSAGATDLNPTLDGSDLRDHSRSGWRIEGNEAYQTIEGARDYSKPGLVREGDTVYETLPGSSVRDYSKPGLRVEE